MAKQALLLLDGMETRANSPYSAWNILWPEPVPSRLIFTSTLARQRGQKPQ
jgi:hypothetical protein